MTLAAALITATIASAVLAGGTWLAMTGGVTLAVVGRIDDEADRADMIRRGAAMLLAGLFLFGVGAIAGLRILA